MSSFQLVVVSKTTFASFDLPASGAVMLGRSEQCDLRIDDASVTRSHALLHVGRELEIEDLGSVNGTRVRQQRLPVRTRAVVHPGEPFYVGTVLVMVQVVAKEPGGPVRGEDLDTKREEPRTFAPGARSGPAGEVARVVHDPAMRELDSLVARVAQGMINVLVLGESGVGKELVVERLHEASPRRGQPLLRLNCAALPESVIEAEWFGYERGSFSGAVAAKAGLLESANGGTVFLDEIGEMPLAVQAKMLRVIEARETFRLGAMKPRPLDVRFVAATNRALEEEVRQGRFRQDLFFRLNGVAIQVPPLRQRPSEIEPLAQAFIVHAARGLGLRPPSLRADALSLLRSYTWPGNVRELRNFIERAVLLSGGPELTPEHFPLAAMAATLAPQRVSAHGDDPVPASETERERIVRVLAECGGNQSRAAKALGIARSTLVLRLDEYAIVRPQRR
ncbi:MAG: uncharacterized protein JWP97_4147 [Labilithrix sp.]|nr:uncharacterized protein [Labilithrix sp.]